MGGTPISSHLGSLIPPPPSSHLAFTSQETDLAETEGSRPGQRVLWNCPFWGEKPCPELWTPNGSVFAVELPPGNRWAQLWSKKSFMTDRQLPVCAGECPNLVFSHSTGNGHIFSFLAHLNLIMCIPQLYRVFLFTAFL